MPDTITPTFSNQILRSLNSSEFEKLRPVLEVVELPSGTTLYRANEEIDYIYFPNHSVISVIASTVTGQSAEVGLIGIEGAVGIEGLMGAKSTPHDIVAHFGDGAQRARISAVAAHFNQSGQFHDLLLQFTRRFIVQLSQKALCNRVHSLEQRLGRWLLMCQDRYEKGQLRLTQELLSIMLGATRASVTLAAIEMQNQGLINYSRGSITILDRKGIEALTCDCYAIIKQAYEEE